MNSTIFDYFQRAALLILTPKCFDNYFIDFNYLDAQCFKSTLSKCLGIGIILGSLLVKVPQILKLLKNKSGEGISVLSVTLELCAITIYMSYNFVKKFPFSAWGDTTFLALQTLAVAALVLHYNKEFAKAITYVVVYFVISFILMSGLTPVEILWFLASINIGVAVSAKLLQAWTNYKNGHTGQLSAITLIMLFGGSAARIFTSIQETGDLMLVLTFVCSTLANAVLVFQLLFYWNVDVKKKSE